jgi:hypothetical protein
MPGLDQFRIYYNHTIHPELMRMERLRIRLLRLFLLSAAVLLAIIFLGLQSGELTIVLALAIPVIFYLGFLSFRTRTFIKTFKPRIVKLILDFISESPNIGTLDYSPEGFLSRELFFQSMLFSGHAPVYLGEDLIYGKVGEMDFQLCELRVQDFSPVDNRLVPVFGGIFLHAVFPEESSGQVVIWPRSQRKHLSRTIRNFVLEGGQNSDREVLNPAFREAFMTYATPQTHVAGVLSEPMQDAILHYFQLSQKDIYVSFIEQDIYVAITETKDILEPFIFRSNVRFELVRGYYQDIRFLLNIIEDFDRTH